MGQHDLAANGADFAMVFQLARHKHPGSEEILILESGNHACIWVTPCVKWEQEAFATTLASGKRTAKMIESVLLTLSSILSSARKWGYKVPEVALSDLSLPPKVKVKSRYTFAVPAFTVLPLSFLPLTRPKQINYIPQTRR
jgi:hypothetical protein